MAEHDELLRRFQPVLRYDSNEQFFADGAAQFTVNPGNELRRERSVAGNGTVIARAQPASGEPALTLSFLGTARYKTGIVLDPLKHYDVSTSTIAGDPPVPSAAARNEIEPYTKPVLTPLRRLLAFVGATVARIRGDR